MQRGWSQAAQAHYESLISGFILRNIFKMAVNIKDLYGNSGKRFKIGWLQFKREIWICIHKKYSENHIFQSFNTIYLLKMLKTICNSKDKILRNGEDCFSTSHFFNNSAKSNATLRGLLFSLFFVTHLTTSACRSSAPIKRKPKNVQFPCKKRKTTKLWKERFLLQYAWK